LANEPRDVWAKIDIAARLIGSILLPIIILIIGNWYTSQQQHASEARLKHDKEMELAQRNADRITLFLSYLTSDNPRSRKLSLEILSYFAKNSQFPNELLPAVIASVNDKDVEVGNAGSSTLTQIAKSSRTSAKAIVKAAESQPESAKSVVKATKSNPELVAVFKDADPQSSFTRNLGDEVAVTFLSKPSGAKVSYKLLLYKYSEERPFIKLSSTTPTKVRLPISSYIFRFELNNKIVEREVKFFGENNYLILTASFE
jgi:hypothetical protein